MPLVNGWRCFSFYAVLSCFLPKGFHEEAFLWTLDLYKWLEELLQLPRQNILVTFSGSVEIKVVLQVTVSISMFFVGNFVLRKIQIEFVANSVRYRLHERKSLLIQGSLRIVPQGHVGVRNDT